jgi:hypothetical protein
MTSTDSLTVWTIGHSTRLFEDFLAILRAYVIERVIDVRIWPHSRRYPWFDGPALASALPAAGIGYTHLPELGGHRHPRPDSPNTGWRNLSFRGYADYMQTCEFAAALADLLALAEEARVATMCAEAVPWRCHRSLISDALLVRGARVVDIFSLTSARQHGLTSFAQATATQLVYPAVEGAIITRVARQGALEASPRGIQAGVSVAGGTSDADDPAIAQARFGEGGAQPRAVTEHQRERAVDGVASLTQLPLGQDGGTPLLAREVAAERSRSSPVSWARSSPASLARSSSTARRPMLRPWAKKARRTRRS